MPEERLLVKIFSRDGKDNYTWLIAVLKGDMFKNLVDENVQGIYISRDFRSFIESLKECSFAILYHTKNRGRLNIANVTDSLYDEELRAMCAELGIPCVIVMVDDLEDSDGTVRNRILEQQFLIEECASDLILISVTEKKAANLDGDNPKLSPTPTSPSLQADYISLLNKLNQLRDYMEKATNKVCPPPKVIDLVDIKDIEAKEDDPLRNNTDLEEGIQPPRERQKLSSRMLAPFTRLTQRDKMVFFIVGGLIVLFVIILIIVLSHTLLPYKGSSDAALYIIIQALEPYGINATVWLTCILCVFHFIKIVQFSSRFLSWLKMKIDALVPWLIMVVELMTLGFSFLVEIVWSLHSVIIIISLSSSNETENDSLPEFQLSALDDAIFFRKHVSLGLVILITA
ncbi:uncharacterized protein [Hyperolius riggenbachi]|uniref:uncharacterized protein n=1 Tax=Hyperolius riggenbachi TaxID=752182 RepID=UPI0035A3150E